VCGTSLYLSGHKDMPAVLCEHREGKTSSHTRGYPKSPERLSNVHSRAYDLYLLLMPQNRHDARAITSNVDAVYHVNDYAILLLNILTCTEHRMQVHYMLIHFSIIPHASYLRSAAILTIKAVLSRKFKTGRQLEEVGFGASLRKRLKSSTT
jgi:hypothetical protein